MRFGWLVEQRLAWSDLAVRVAEVKRHGYGSLWVSDHLFDENGGWLLDCWTTAASLATVPDVEIGTLVAANTLRHPALVAQHARSLAQITGGRFVLGIGAGGSVEEHDAVGLPFPPFAERLVRLDEACAKLRQLLEGAALEPDSGHYPMCVPAAAPTGVPLLVGGTSPAVLAITARHADRWTVWADPETFSAGRALLAEHCAALGRAAGDIRCAAIVMVIPNHLPAKSDRGWPAVMGGDADAMRAEVDRFARSGADELIVCDFAVCEESRMAALEWFAENVMAHTPEQSS